MGRSAYALFQQGRALLSDGHPHQAVVPLEQARDLEPEKASIRETLARAYYGSGHTTRAAEEFEAAVELDPTNDYAHFGLALCLERQGNVERAVGHAKLAFVMRPDEENYRRALERMGGEPPA